MPDEKAAFLNRSISALILNRGFKIEELNYSKFRLRNALENKIKSAKRLALANIYKELVKIPANFKTDNDVNFVFQNAKYAFDYAYSGFTELPKHFFPQIGNLKESGEEFSCALFLAIELSGLRYWVRNVERKSISFSLQTSTDRFYPDFVCLMQDGRILVIEYKNKRDWELADNKEKREIGELWERRSDGKCIFVMPQGQQWLQIQAALNK